MFKKNILLALIALILSLSLILSQGILCQPCYAKEKKDDYSAKALYLMDYNTGEVLFEKNSQEKLPVASIVKLMTICITCQKLDEGAINLDQKVVVSENAAGMGGSQVFIEANAEYTIGDLLKSTIVSSANDASVALAEVISGSEENFVELMNEKAQKLGLKNTNYSNCTGLPTINQFSSAEDTAKLLKEVFSYDAYHKYSTIWMDTLLHPNDRESELVNTNKLIRHYEGCDGGKTGSTSEAGYCLVATAKRGNMRLIGVVLGAENGKARFAETSKLLNYGFLNFENKLVVSKSFTDDLSIEVIGGEQKNAYIEPEKEIYLLLKKNSNDEISTEIKLSENVKAPIKKGENLGEILIVKNNEIIQTVNLVSKNDIESASYFDILQNISNNWKIA